MNSSLPIVDRFRERIKGSELDQLLRWINFTNLNANESDKILSIAKIDIAENTLRLYPGDPLFNNIPSLWKPTNTSTCSQRMLLPDCIYRIKEIQSAIECRENAVNAFDPFCNLNFLIEQYNCQSSKDPNSTAKLLGGSSFEIGFYSSYSVTSCKVLDNYDNTYLSMCDFPMSMFNIADEKQRKNSILKHVPEVHLPSEIDKIYCLALNATVGYEHYDAFSEQKFRGLKMRFNFLAREPVVQSGGSLFCYKIYDILSESKRARATTNVVDSSPNAIAYWGIMKHLPGSADSSVYQVPQLEWKSTKPTDFLSISSFHHCLHQQHGGIILLGASHLRYVWDFLVSIYFPHVPLWTLEKYHADGNLHGLIYSEVDLINFSRLTRQMDRWVHKIPEGCFDKQLMTFVVQTGTHDLVRFSPRYLILSEVLLPAVLKAIEDIIESQMKGNCSTLRAARVILLSPPLKSMQQDESFQNFDINPNLKALNDYLTINFKRLQVKYSYQSKIKLTYRYIDVNEFIEPMLFHFPEIYESQGGHYILHPPFSDLLISTPPGRIMVSRIINEVCDGLLNEDNKTAYDHSILQNGMVFTSWNSTIQQQYHEGPVNILGDPMKRVYLFENGIKRMVPDNETFYHLGFNRENLLEVSAVVADNIPSDRNLISRKQNQLYRVYQTRYNATYLSEVVVRWYRIIDGRRHFLDFDYTHTIKNHDYFKKFGREAPDFDLYSIPIGKNLNLTEALNDMPIGVVNSGGDNSIFAIRNFSRRWVPNIDTLNFLGMSMNYNLYLAKADAESIPLGPPIPPCRYGIDFPC